MFASKLSTRELKTVHSVPILSAKKNQFKIRSSDLRKLFTIIDQCEKH